MYTGWRSVPIQTMNYEVAISRSVHKWPSANQHILNQSMINETNIAQYPRPNTHNPIPTSHNKITQFESLTQGIY